MRTQGTFNFGANLEVKKDAPLDARTLVPSYADLTLDATWKDSDGNAWTYPGMLVTCLDRPGKLYQLTAADYTKSANWREIGAEVDLSDYATKENTVKSIDVDNDSGDLTITVQKNDDTSSSIIVPQATEDNDGAMSATDKANLDRMQVGEGGTFSVDNTDGILFQIPTGEGGFDHEVQMNEAMLRIDDNSFNYPSTSGTLALQSDITAAVSTKADSSALTALETKVDTKADSADLPTAIEDTEINDICK